MTRLAFVLVLCAPALALAQPGDPGGFDQPEPDQGTVPESPDQADQPADPGAEPLPDDAQPRDGDELTEVPPSPTAEPEPGFGTGDEIEADVEAQGDAQFINGHDGFMDVRLNFTFTNENVFAEPGETLPSIPGWRFGTPNSLGVLFFDNYDTRYSGYETLAHAVLYKQYLRGNWEFEGAMVLRMLDLAEDRIELSDAGSYLRTAYWFDPTHKKPERISVVVFPTSSDRMRLGYSYRLSWGGSPEYDRAESSVPGIKVQYDTGNAYAYVGAKSAEVNNAETDELESVMAFMGGAGVDVTPMLRVEANGGFFNRGSNELESVRTEDVQLFGGSVQVALHDGMPVGSSIDYKLYRNDPERVGRLFRREEYPGGLSWMAASEATLIGQTLADPDTAGSTTVQWGAAGDVNLRVKYNRTRLRFDLQYRDLAFLLHSIPSLPTFSDFPMVYEPQPNLFAAAGVDQNFRDQLTVGVVVGVDRPASLEVPTGRFPTDMTEGSGRSTVVFRDDQQLTILPEGEGVVPQFATKVTARLDFGAYFAAILDTYYTYDPNQTRLRRESREDQFEFVFGEFHQLGFNATLQARW